MCRRVGDGREGRWIVSFKEGQEVGKDLGGVVQIAEGVDDGDRRVLC